MISSKKNTQETAKTLFPYIIEASHSKESLLTALPKIQANIQQQFAQYGAVLLRGFTLYGIEDFYQILHTFNEPLLMPFTRIDNSVRLQPKLSAGYSGVYQIEYAPYCTIPLHQKQAQFAQAPQKLWFYCQQAAQQGGEIILSDQRKVYRALDPEIREEFETLQLKYLRNYGNGLDIEWPQAFQTGKRAQVEQICKDYGITAEWQNNGNLRTYHHQAAVIHHPETLEKIWFNQADLYHYSALAPEILHTLLACVDESCFPKQVYFGNDMPISRAKIEYIRHIISTQQITLSLHSGDVLLLDNLLIAHGHLAFQGESVLYQASTHLITLHKKTEHALSVAQTKINKLLPTFDQAFKEISNQ